MPKSLDVEGQVNIGGPGDIVVPVDARKSVHGMAQADVRGLVDFLEPGDFVMPVDFGGAVDAEWLMNFGSPASTGEPVALMGR
ncbi:hypothetical protein [Ancylothrix sp. D3o]|uniref:hypothetical protein n=1 Tax=Ancylothrix sp. D3o TaxID=2953691 RepID=UPI0021BB6907|nr:hypothetical protein [Ancylothrix sp. D3o]